MNTTMLGLCVVIVTTALGCASSARHTGGAQHYESGYVVFVDRPDPPNTRYEVKGKMDVTPGDYVFTVSTKDGVYFIPRERLVYSGPDPQAIAKAAEGPGAVDTSRASLSRLANGAGGQSIPATLFYAGSNRDYDYYYLAHPNAQQMYKVNRDQNSQVDRMEVTDDRDRWRRVRF